MTIDEIDPEEEWKRHVSRAPFHTDVFYAQVESILKQPEIQSCGYFGRGDFRILEIMCNEQIKRNSDEEVSKLDQKFPLAYNSDYYYPEDALKGKILHYSEGLGKYLDLYIDDYPGNHRASKIALSSFRVVKMIISVAPQLYIGEPVFSDSVARCYVYDIDRLRKSAR